MVNGKNKVNGGFRSERRLLRFIWNAACGWKHAVVASLVLEMLIGLLPASITFYVQNMFASVDGQMAGLLNTRNLLLLCGVVLVFIFLKEGVAVAQSYAMINIKRNIERWYLERLTQSDYATVHDRLDNRNVMAVTRESEMVTLLLPDICRSFVGAPLTILGFIVLLLWVSPMLTVAVMLLLAVVVLCAVCLRRRIKNASRVLFNRYSDMHVSFSEWLRGYKVFKLYGATDFIYGRLDSIVEDTSVLSKQLTRMQCVQSVAVELLTYSIVIVFVFLLSYTGIEASWQTLISFPTAILFIRNESLKITKGYSHLMKTESASRRLLDEIENTVETHEGLEWTDKIQEISFDDVSFSYDGADGNVIDRANVSLKAGGLYVLTGVSGAGKSTCFDLMMGLRTPVSGKVRFNGMDIRPYSTESLMRHISYVEQEPFVFEGTLKENLAFGRDVDETLIHDLCRDLRLEHITGNAVDPNTMLAIDGKNLSAGERQRIAFMRAMIKDPDVVFLDETTSSVDSETSDIMLRYMQDIAKKKIVICISHDYRLISKSDYIIHLQDGKLVIG